jgi:hypothetical protein
MKEFALLLLLFWPAILWAGAATTLTEAQYATLKANIEANSAEFAGKSDAEIAAAYNLPATPAFQVYKIAVTRNAILLEKSPQATVFIPTTNGWATRTTQELTLFAQLFDAQGVMDPSLPNVNAILTFIFSGTGDAQLNRVHIGNQSRELSTRAERLYIASGAGTNGDPGVRDWKGILSARDIAHAKNPSTPLN